MPSRGQRFEPSTRTAAPARWPFLVPGDNERLSAQEKGDVLLVQFEPPFPGSGKRLRDVWILHETVARRRRRAPGPAGGP